MFLKLPNTISFPHLQDHQGPFQGGGGRGGAGEMFKKTKGRKNRENGNDKKIDKEDYENQAISKQEIKSNMEVCQAVN